LSATAPLDAELARQIESQLDTSLLEMFGSTETCVIATRRTSSEQSWHMYPEVLLEPDAEGVNVNAPWFAAPMRLQDVIEREPGNRFIIKTNAPVVEVSWQVTGVRSDATARKYHFEVEEEKGERERGYYANPDAYGQPEERGIEWARNPQLMQQMKQQRLEAGHMRLKQQPNQR